ncbi:MAG: hypothetical protein LC777_00330 [Actinobacteria bacterium]|nr:hypothetical protein [Actinomycetota bacterium]
MSDEDLSAHAADLAERILDEVCTADQGWHRVEEWARELADLAASVARRATEAGAEAPDR